MATSYDELIELCDEIRTSTEPESITATMVGSLLEKMTAYTKEVLDKLNSKTANLTDEEIVQWNAAVTRLNTIRTATRTTLGLVKIGKNITISSDGTISAISGSGEVELATKDIAGIVRIGDNLYISDDGVLSAGPAGGDIATADKAGIVKPGSDFDIATDGTLSLYVTPAVSAFSISPSIVEDGTTVTSVTPTFSFNKTMASAKINNADATSGTAITGSWTAETSFALVGTDAKGNTASKTVKLSFGYKFYAGMSTDGTKTATSANITGLGSSVVKTSKNYGSYTTGSKGYLYIAFPDSWGTPTYTDGKAIYSFDKVGTANVTANGKTVSYALYKSGSQLPSGTSITIS